MTSPITQNSATTAAVNTAQTPQASGGKTDATGRDVFLKLLVAQIKNQDPLNPMDGMNYVTQLAQFSQLDALLGIRGDLDTILAKGAAQPAESNP